MNAIASLANTLTGSAIVTQTKTPTLAQCKAEMSKQITAGQKGLATTFQAAVALGEAATMAKDLCGHGKWNDWLKENFEAKGTWVRVCMRAAAAWHLLASKPETYRAQMLDKFNTVEKFADTLPTLDQGEDPLIGMAPKRTRAPNKLQIVKDASADAPTDVTPRDVVDTGKGANEHAELAKREKALDRREKDLDARSAKLDTREQKLALREAAVAQKEEALKAKAPTKRDPMGLKPDASIDELKEKAKAAAAKAVAKASPKAPPAATSPANGKVRATPPARAKKAPVIDPGTVASIQDAAARAVPATIPVVDHSASNALIAAAVARGDFDAPKADEAGNEAF